MSGKEPMPVVRKERPRRRSSRKLLFLLFLFFAALLGVLFFQSSFSKIHRIDVAGNRLLDKEQIVEAAGIAVGDHFFAGRAAEWEERILRLDAVERARVVKRFPGEVYIEVSEFPVVALELTKDGVIAGLLANAASVEYGSVENAAARPVLSGWEDAAMKRRMTETLAEIAPELLQDISEIRHSPTVSYPDRIVLYTRSRYEVVTTISYLPEKLTLLNDYVYELKISDRTAERIIMLETNYAEPVLPEGGGEAEGEAEGEAGGTADGKTQ